MSGTMTSAGVGSAWVFKKANRHRKMGSLKNIETST